MQKYFTESFSDHTILDSRAESYFTTLLQLAQNSTSESDLYSIQQQLATLLESLFPSSNCIQCDPNHPQTTCIYCKQCKPTCTTFNHECYKCNPEILTFNNFDRLVHNKQNIDKLVKDYLFNTNEISFKNTLILIRLHLSVLPSLV